VRSIQRFKALGQRKTSLAHGAKLVIKFRLDRCRARVKKERHICLRAD
jgi:hypothetical protein